MGKLIVTEFLTVDGVAQAPGGPDEDREGGFPYGGWQAPLLDDAMGEAMFEQARSMDALLLGRRTYEIFASYWPTGPSESPFTGLLNRVPKFVASRTLKPPLSWAGSTLVGSDFVQGIEDIKSRHAETHVIGSLDMVQSLLRHGLVDALQLWVHPVMLGEGKRLFSEGVVPTTLRLTKSFTFPNGTLQLEYAPAGEARFGTIGA